MDDMWTTYEEYSACAGGDVPVVGALMSSQKKMEITDKIFGSSIECIHLYVTTKPREFVTEHPPMETP
jgi:hypothetical protein